MNSTALFSATFYLATISIANPVQQKSFRQDPFNHPDFPNVALCVFGIIVLSLLITVLVTVVSAIKVLRKNVRIPNGTAQSPVRLPRLRDFSNAQAGVK